MTAVCARCAEELHGPKETELCWWCEDTLCEDCWEVFGHCGHPAADQANHDYSQAQTEAERARIMMRPGPIGATREKQKRH